MHEAEEELEKKMPELLGMYKTFITKYPKDLKQLELERYLYLLLMVRTTQPALELLQTVMKK